MTSEKKKDQEEPAQPPVDGPSPGESGEEKEETSASSYDKPGSGDDDDS